MPEAALESNQLDAVLAQSDIVRVAFPADPAPYVIPLGFLWDGVSMRGTGMPGRKTDLAGDGVEVGFQIDTSARTGVFEWVSVSGHGRFVVIEDEVERARSIAELEDFASRAPEWWAEEQLARAASDDFVVWSLTPTQMAGRRYSPDGGPLADYDAPVTERGVLALDLSSASDMLDSTRREESVRLAKVMVSQFILIPLFMIIAAQGVLAGMAALTVLLVIEVGLFRFMNGLAPSIARLEQSVEEAKAALETREGSG